MSDQENTTKEKGERISKRMDNNKKGNQASDLNHKNNRGKRTQKI